MDDCIAISKLVAARREASRALQDIDFELQFSENIICDSIYGCSSFAVWIVIAPFMFEDGRKSMVICDKHRLLHIDSESRDGRPACTYLPL